MHYSIFPPYTPVRGTTSSPRSEFGGTLVGNARAAHDHWPVVLETLAGLE